MLLTISARPLSKKAERFLVTLAMLEYRLMGSLSKCRLVLMSTTWFKFSKDSKRLSEAWVSMFRMFSRSAGSRSWDRNFNNIEKLAECERRLWETMWAKFMSFLFCTAVISIRLWSWSAFFFMAAVVRPISLMPFLFPGRHQWWLLV